MIGVSQIDRVVEAVEQTLQGNTVRMMAKKELPRLDLPKVRKNPLVEIIPLSTGCLGACTYCKTRYGPFNTSIVYTGELFILPCKYKHAMRVFIIHTYNIHIFMHTHIINTSTYQIDKEL